MENEPTTQVRLEPDLVRVFRLFMIWQVLMLIIWSALQSIAPEPRQLKYQLFAAVVPAALIPYCSAPALQRGLGRAFLPIFFREFLPPSTASHLGPVVASILIYVLMAAVLFWKPQGLFPPRG